MPQGSPHGAGMRRRTGFVVVTALLACLELLLKQGMVKMLGPETADLGVIALRVGHNPGVAFGAGDNVPSWLMVGVIGLITAGVIVYGLQTVPSSSRTFVAALTLVAAGAVANLYDRLGDGMVTDYLYTGWFSTFNLADCYITLGAAGIIWALFRQPAPTAETG